MSSHHSGEFDRFSQLVRSGALAEALALAEKQTRTDRDRPAFWHTQRAHVLMRMKRYAQAADAAREALTTEPTNAWALITLGDALVVENDPKQALSCYEQVRDHADLRIRERAAIGILECMARQKKWQDILDFLQSARIESARRFSLTARAHRGLGNSAEAIRICREWLAQMPDNPRALWLLCELETETEGIEPVKQRYSRLARIPSKPPIYAELYASLCRKAGVPQEALGQYDKIQARTGDPRAARQKAFTLAKNGRETEALPLMEELLRIDLHDSYIHTSYCAAAKRCGQADRASTFYESLLAANPDQKNLYGWLKRVRKPAPRAATRAKGSA